MSLLFFIEPLLTNNAQFSFNFCYKHGPSDALMLFFCLILTTQEDLIHSCVAIKAGIH